MNAESTIPARRPFTSALQGLNLLSRLLGRQPIPLSHLPGGSSTVATHHNFTPIVKDKNLVPAWANNGVDPLEHKWLLYVPPAVPLNTCTTYPHSILHSQNQHRFLPNRINRVIFVMSTLCSL